MDFVGIISTIKMLLLISMLILVHEIGHFLAAKAFGIRVARFALGLPFGPTLYRKKFGETEFLIHSFFLGGYVAFEGDADMEAPNAPEDATAPTQKPEEVLSDDSPLLFKNKKPWQQAVVISAGVVANAVFALVLVFCTALYYGKLPSGKADVKIKEISVSAKTTQTPANFGEHSNIVEVGIKPGDRVLSVNGIKIDNAYKFIFLVQKSKLFDGLVDEKQVAKNLEKLQKLNPELNKGVTISANTKIILPDFETEEPLNVKDHVVSGYEKYEPKETPLTPLQKDIRDAAFQKPSLVLKVPIESLKEVAMAISDSYKPLTITVLRNGEMLEFKNIHTNKNGLLGVKLDSEEILIPTQNVKSALKVSTVYIYDNTRQMCFGLWQLITGKIPMKEMHGIVAITKIGGDIIENRGLLNGLLLTAIISVNLALINLLPIPALDGGHLMFLALEKIRGRKLNERTLEKINSVFFMALIFLMVFIVFNDVYGLIIKKF